MGSYRSYGASQLALEVENHPPSPAVTAGEARDTGAIPGSGRSPGGGHGNPLQYPCLENRHEQRSLAGYSPWGHKGLDMTEAIEHSCTGPMKNIKRESMLQISGVAGNRWSGGFLDKRICEPRPGWWNEAAREKQKEICSRQRE